jgi:uncharacterized protein
VIEIPLQELSAEALQGVLEEFVNRDGTDYGEVELSLTQKVQQLLTQWRRAEVVLVFDPESETTTFVSRDEWRHLKSGLR